MLRHVLDGNGSEDLSQMDVSNLFKMCLAMTDDKRKVFIMTRLQRVVSHQIEGQDSPSRLRTLVDFLGSFAETMDFAEDSCLYLLDRQLLT